MRARPRAWARAEQLTVLRYYLQTEFGRLHAGNPEIQAIAGKLGRTASSIAMKGSNYASLDPKITSTGRKGLNQASKLDRDAWDLMHNSFEAFEEESSAAAINFGLDPVSLAPVENPVNGHQGEPGEVEIVNDGETETAASVVTRRKQAFFRQAVLTAYRNTCPITGISVPALLNASHIIPWSANSRRRLDPSNGIALNALHDRAFDRGLITFENDLVVLV